MEFKISYRLGNKICRNFLSLPEDSQGLHSVLGRTPPWEQTLSFCSESGVGIVVLSIMRCAMLSDSPLFIDSKAIF